MLDPSPQLPSALPAGPALAEIAAPGRVIELSGRGAVARTTTAALLLLDAQREGETTAWIQPKGGALFPPDLAAAGVDLDALVVAHVPAERGAQELLRAAEHLLRAGAFGLVVVDLGGLRLPRGGAWQARLTALARHHQSRLVLLTDTPAHEGSLGPLIGLRIDPRRRRDAGLLVVDPHVLKNKSGRPCDPRPEFRRPPAGLRLGAAASARPSAAARS